MRAIKRFVLVLMIFWASSSAEEYDNDEQQFDASAERTGDNAELTDGNPEQVDYADYEDSAEYDNASETKSDYQYSYSYQDYKDVESELDILPEMKSSSESIVVKKGETAKFPCKATDSAQLVRIWQRDDGNVIFTGNVKVSRQDNHHLDSEENTTLVITDTQPHDAGSYTCRVMIRARDEISVSHRLIVNTQAFEISPVPTNGILSIEEGDDASVQCKLSGEDVPEKTEGTIRWNKEGSRFRDGSYTLTGDLELQIENVTKEDAGKYFCTATSIKGEAKSTLVEVIVQSKPVIISLTKATMQTGRGLVGELTCLSIGEPDPKVTWYKGNEVVQLDDRKTSENAGNRHILLINRLNQDDVGIYMCYTINELGSAQNIVEISAQDLLPEIKAEENQDTKKEVEESGLSINAEILESFKEKIENDISSLRNLTYSSIQQSQRGASSSNIDTAIFVDLQRLQLELRQFQALSEAHMKEIKSFERTAKDDFQRLWDHVNELQEVTNITSKHMEDIYDKDILPLQNFKALTEAKLAKLKEDVEDYGALKSPSQSSNVSNTEFISILTKAKKRLDSLEDEQSRQKVQLEKLQESQTLARSEIQRIFEDIDGFKKQSQSLSQEQLKLQRELQSLENGKITDLSHLLDTHSRQLEDLDHFKEKTSEDAKETSAETDQKFSVMVKELQGVKSQIYYLQQSILQLRGAIKSSGGVETSIAPLPPSLVANSVTDERLTEIQSKLEQCAEQNDLVKIRALIEARTNEFNEALTGLNTELNSAKENVVEVLSKNEAEIKANAEKIGQIETAEKKYNLIVQGLPQERKLERPTHLELVLKKFFKQTLRLNGINFEEAERQSCPKNEGEDAEALKCAIKVRFPSVRDKIKVLQASRTSANTLRNEGITIIEDFTEKVLQHRQSLALYARRRARKTKKKWALKYDELYFNGKIFFWNEQTNRVEEKTGS